MPREVADALKKNGEWRREGASAAVEPVAAVPAPAPALR